MAYDLMNRRDNLTAHASSITGANHTVQRYINDLSAPPEKLNLGFAYYAKYFQTSGPCPSGLGCPIVPAEDSATGADQYTSGAWTFETDNMQPIDTRSIATTTDGTCGVGKGKCGSSCCSQYGNCGFGTEFCAGGCQHAFSGAGLCTGPDVFESWQTASANSQLDEKEGGRYYWDGKENLFWTWEDEDLIKRKVAEVFDAYGLGGVMAWSLGEDSNDWGHVKAMADALGNGRYQASTLESQQKAKASDGALPAQSTQEVEVVQDDGSGGSDQSDTQGTDDASWEGWCADPLDPTGETWYPCDELEK
jgi:chitinase